MPTSYDGFKEANRHMLRKLLIGVLLVGTLGACTTTNAKNEDTVTISKEDKELLDKLKAKERAKRDLLRTPSKYLTAENWDLFDKGIINSYSKATALVIKNSSRFDVSDIEGKITYQTETGEEMATVPFKAQGDIRAGETKKLPIAAQEISGAAKRHKAVFERLRILGE